jgi:hypothetical protein
VAGETSWERWLARLRYFGTGELEAAKAWLAEA